MLKQEKLEQVISFLWIKNLDTQEGKSKIYLINSRMEITKRIQKKERNRNRYGPEAIKDLTHLSRDQQRDYNQKMDNLNIYK